MLSRISEYVFFNPQRPSKHIQSVKTAWRHALKLAGIPRFPSTSVATLSRPDLGDWVCRTRLSTNSSFIAWRSPAAITEEYSLLRPQQHIQTRACPSGYSARGSAPATHHLAHHRMPPHPPSAVVSVLTEIRLNPPLTFVNYPYRIASSDLPTLLPTSFTSPRNPALRRTNRESRMQNP